MQASGAGEAQCCTTSRLRNRELLKSDKRAFISIAGRLFINAIAFPDLTDAIVQLRIICGLLFIPHILAQFTAKDAVFGFFEAAGLKPAWLFVRTALVVQIVVLLGLVLGIYVFYAAWLGGIFMICAGLAAFKVSKGRWVWNLGGCEFHMFWGLCCIVVALHSPA